MQSGPEIRFVVVGGRGYPESGILGEMGLIQKRSGISGCKTLILRALESVTSEVQEEMFKYKFFFGYDAVLRQRYTAIKMLDYRYTPSSNGN